MKKRIGASILCLLMLLTQTVFAINTDAVDAAYRETAAYVYNSTQSPAVGSVGGEWAIIGLARGGHTVPDGYYDSYYAAVCDHASEKNGVLSRAKYTEYSRVVLALTAIGKDPSDVAGYDLIKPLLDTERVNSQGLNGAVWALIALDSGSYAVGVEAREIYIKTILERQLPDGGWALAKTAAGSEPDMTAMALTALSGCRGRADVEAAIEKALIYLSAEQNEDGGFSDTSGANAETCAQVVTALASLGVPIDDARFVKAGSSVLDAMLCYRTADGGFAHSPGGEVNAMSTEQALYALAAVKRSAEGRSGIYVMNDDARARFIGILGELLAELRAAVN